MATRLEERATSTPAEGKPVTTAQRIERVRPAGEARPTAATTAEATPTRARTGRGWRYAEAGKRDLRLDFLRGFAVFAMATDHIAAIPGFTTSAAATASSSRRRRVSSSSPAWWSASSTAASRVRRGRAPR